MNESQFWQKVKVGLESQQTHCERIEDCAGSGVPDVNCCWKGHEFWLELKIVREQRVGIRSSQSAWAIQRSARGGNIWLFAYDSGTIIGYRGKKIYELGLVKGDIGTVKPTMVWSKPWDWEQILGDITGVMVTIL